MARQLVAAALAAFVALAAPGVASAALLWTLVATPLAVSTGVETTFTLTATNGDLLTEIGCVVVDVPTNFSIASVGISGSTAGNSWVASRSGNRVTAQTTSGGDRLALLQSVTFTVRAMALSSGSIAWSSNAFRQQDCSQAGSLIGVPPLIVVTGPSVTPTPASTPPPTPTPAPTPPPTLPVSATPRPTTAATPPPLSSPAPTVGATPRATPRPTGGASGPSTVPGSATPRPTPSGSASSEPDPARTPTPSGQAETPAASASSSAPPPGSGTGAGGATPSSPSAGGEGAAPALTLRLDDEGGVALTSSSIGVLAGLQTWAVPAATIAVPGLLVLLWVALQAIGALAWVPATRRLRGGTAPQRGRAA